jgi:hypothetical protein
LYSKHFGFSGIPKQLFVQIEWHKRQWKTDLSAKKIHPLEL